MIAIGGRSLVPTNSSQGLGVVGVEPPSLKPGFVSFSDSLNGSSSRVSIRAKAMEPETVSVTVSDADLSITNGHAGNLGMACWIWWPVWLPRKRWEKVFVFEYLGRLMYVELLLEGSVVLSFGLF